MLEEHSSKPPSAAATFGKVSPLLKIHDGIYIIYLVQVEVKASSSEFGTL